MIFVDPPFFTLISVTLNHLEGLKKTYHSIQKQIFKDFEWLIIDGQSLDNTPEWLADLECDEFSYSYSSEPDDGLYDAMNKGINRACGQYLIFLNAGDMLPNEDTLKSLQNAIVENSFPDFIYGDAFEDQLDAGLFYKAAKPASQLHRGMITHHQAMVYKQALCVNLRYNMDYKYAADYDFTARFLEKSKDSLYLAYPLCTFKAGGLSYQYANQSRLEEFHIRRTLSLCELGNSVLIYMRQACSFYLKRFAPGFYRFFRSIRS